MTPDPLKPGVKTTEAWLTAIASVALPLLTKFAGLPTSTQWVVAVIVVGYLVSRAAPKAAAAFGADAGRYRAERNIALKRVAELEATVKQRDAKIAELDAYIQTWAPGQTK